MGDDAATTTTAVGGVAGGTGMISTQPSLGRGREQPEAPQGVMPRTADMVRALVRHLDVSAALIRELEFPVFVRLGFSLHLPRAESVPHMERLHREAEEEAGVRGKDAMRTAPQHPDLHLGLPDGPSGSDPGHLRFYEPRKEVDEDDGDEEEEDDDDLDYLEEEEEEEEEEEDYGEEDEADDGAQQCSGEEADEEVDLEKDVIDGDVVQGPDALQTQPHS